MPSLGPAEILVIMVIALLVFGPDKMPDIARQVGRGFREFRRVQNHLKAELRDVVSEFDSADDDQETGTPAPAATGDPVPSLPPLNADGTDLPATENGAETPTQAAAAQSAASTESAAQPAAPAPPAEVALPPAEVALPPAEVALPPVEVALPPAQPPAEPS
jgi:sec-independent protein translocase protein TatA